MMMMMMMMKEVARLHRQAPNCNCTSYGIKLQLELAGSNLGKRRATSK